MGLNISDLSAAATQTKVPTLNHVATVTVAHCWLSLGVLQSDW